jgi:hypothetical protein
MYVRTILFMIGLGSSRNAIETTGLSSENFLFYDYVNASAGQSCLKDEKKSCLLH